MGLTRAVVGILADDHHLDRRQRRQVQGVKDVAAARIDDLARLPLSLQKRPQALHVALLELLGERCLPRGLEANPISGGAQGQPLRSLGRIKGNNSTSRMDGESVSSITSRSTPMPSPAVGGRPYSKAVM